MWAEKLYLGFKMCYNKHRGWESMIKRELYLIAWDLGTAGCLKIKISNSVYPL